MWTGNIFKHGRNRLDDGEFYTIQEKQTKIKNKNEKKKNATKRLRLTTSIVWVKLRIIFIKSFKNVTKFIISFHQSILET